MRLTLLLLCTLMLVGISTAQYKMNVSTGRATTSWDSVGLISRALNVIVKNDTSGGSDTLFVASGNDTTAAQIVPILKGESFTFTGWNVPFLRSKSSAHTIPRRIVAF